MQTRFRLRILFLLLVPPLFAASIAAQVPGADCRNLVVNHTYAGNFAGYLNLPVYRGIPDDGTLGVVPNAGAGKITFLPHGKVTNTETIVIGLLGLDQDRLITGNYTLAWDTARTPAVCVGEIHMSDGSTNYDFQLIVSNDGNLVQMIHTNPGLIVETTMFPMSPAGCRNSSMAGTYTYNSTGWALAPATPPTPADQMLSAYIPGAMSGAMRFYPNTPPTAFHDAPAGAGSVRAWDGLSVNGNILTSTRPRNMVGWYKISHDCTLTLVLVDDIGYPPFHIEGFIGRGGSTVYAANIDTTTLPSGQVPMFLMPITVTRNESEK